MGNPALISSDNVQSQLNTIAANTSVTCKKCAVHDSKSLEEVRRELSLARLARLPPPLLQSCTYLYRTSA